MRWDKHRGKMKNIFLEDVAYGIYDRPKKSKDEEEITLKSDLPVHAVDHVSNQLTQQRPPIEDENFVPETPEELSRSVHAMALLVPNEQVEFFYKSAKRLLEKCNDRNAERELGEKNKEVNVEDVKESVRKTLTSLFEEIQYGSPDEYDEFRGVDRKKDNQIDYFGENEPLPQSVNQAADGEMTLDQIAAKFGYKSASGVRQEIQRLTDRLNYFVTKVEPLELENLIDEAAKEYVDIWASSEDLSQEDIDDLKKIGIHRIKKLPAFRYFFVDSFVMPAYREATREATRELNNQIEKLGVPDQLKQAVFNEVTGASSSGTVVKRIADLVSKGKITKDQKPILSKILSNIPSLKRSAEKQANFIQRSRDKWGSKSSRNKKIAVGKAIEMAFAEE